MLQRPPGIESGKVIVGQDQIEIVTEGGDEVGFGVHPPPARLEACRPELADDQLGVVGEVLEDQQAERAGSHASTSVRPTAPREFAQTSGFGAVLVGMVTRSSWTYLRYGACETGCWHVDG